jgi:alkaline phosphatase D
MRRRGFVQTLSLLGGASLGSALGFSNQAQAADQSFKIGFGSCTDQNRPQPIWDSVLADKPNYFIFGGDNVYASEQPFLAQRLREAYAKQSSIPNFARLRATVPHLAIWDDHDFGLNDGGEKHTGKQEAKNEFLNFWTVAADDARRQRDGLYHSQILQDGARRVQVIVLDTRWFRSDLKPSDQRGTAGKERYLPDEDPSKTMLGQAQWLWLEQQLRVPADVRLLVSGIQILADGHGWERWGNFPLERQRLFQLIERTQAKGLVLLSGDRHIGAFYKTSGSTPYPLIEMTSSGITHAWSGAAEAGPNRLGPLVGENHYGLIEINWRQRSIQLQLKGFAGQVLQSQSLGFADLN